MNEWADMVRLARTGGEANAIAIRIARAASAKSKVAICGYHGWHDWYLSANLQSQENLEIIILRVSTQQAYQKNWKELPLHSDTTILKNLKR